MQTQTTTPTTPTTPLQPLQAGSFRTLTARFAGVCRRCNGRIAVGDTIRYGGKGRVYHLAAECMGDSAQPEPVAVQDAPEPEPATRALYCCWLRACDQPAVVGRRHKRFGLVAACADHDPAAHGYDAALILPGQVAQVAAAPAQPAQLGGGQRSRLTPTPPPVTPGGDALAAPAQTAPPKRQTAPRATNRARVAVPVLSADDLF